MKKYEPVDLGDCIVMRETEGGGYVKADDVARLVASHRRLVEVATSMRIFHMIKAEKESVLESYTYREFLKAHAEAEQLTKVVE